MPSSVFFLRYKAKTQKPSPMRTTLVAEGSDRGRRFSLSTSSLWGQRARPFLFIYFSHPFYFCSFSPTGRSFLLPGHTFCLPLSFFFSFFPRIIRNARISRPSSVFLSHLYFSSSFDIHLDWGFIWKAQTMEWLLIKSSSIWPLARYPVVQSILPGRIHLFLN